ncbi:hypothetical protein TNCV_902591 [Trichonephila clavipes]|nr:hypothetical protein TNCV_902591 [Trichonephila clavipes]
MVSYLDSSLNTIGCQSDHNHDDRLRYYSRRFRRCCGVNVRRLKDHCERNPTSDRYRETVECTTEWGKGVMEEDVIF